MTGSTRTHGETRRQVAVAEPVVTDRVHVARPPAPVLVCDTDRWQPGTPASKRTVTVAVRRLAHARGRVQMVQRLRELAAEALAYAVVLDIRPSGIRR